MRVADKMAYEQVNSNIAKNRTQMSELQNQAATQKRVTKPSDDPLAAARVLATRVDLQGNKQFSKSLAYARSFLEYTDQSLAELTEALVRAKELAISQANDASGSESTRRVVAAEVSQLHGQLVQIGNRKLGDRFIFGGYKTQSTPFDITGNYQGDQGEMLIHVDKESFLPMNVPGSRIFLGDGFTPDGPRFAEPLQAKTIEELEQQQIEQVQKESQKPTDVRGPASLRTAVHPNARTGNENGELMVQAGRQTDTGGVNLFRVLKDFETSLRTNSKEGIQDSLDVLDQAISQIVLTRATVGSRAGALDSYTQAKEKEKVENQIQISQLEDADIYSTVSDINKTEATLQATLQTSGKLIQKSLMDFIR
jgi:flagellar hook-associated protein 3 FlgL